jgi:hypothetical protein
MHQGHRVDALNRGFGNRARLAGRQQPAAHPQQALHLLQVVLHAMMDFAQQNLFLLERGLHLLFVLALHGHIMKGEDDHRLGVRVRLELRRASLHPGNRAILVAAAQGRRLVSVLLQAGKHGQQMFPVFRNDDLHP